jgi:transglutaminase-like putative cysteine protease
MFYAVRHLTRFRYDAGVTESLMEVRMQPRSDGNQRCLSFQLTLDPRVRIFAYRDFLGNSVSHFDVPARHRQLVILAESLVEMHPTNPLPNALESSAWDELDALTNDGDFEEVLRPSVFAKPSTLLDRLAEKLGVERRTDPLSLVCELNQSIYSGFDYAPKSTNVDSPIDHALEAQKGVCQDFAHILIALLRKVRIPARYVSGYLFHARGDHSPEGATHAWVEAYFPVLGWCGFDPTNNIQAGDRHIRTAIGRDYADVPPTRGVFKGAAKSELSVSVLVSPSEAPPPPDPEERIIPDEWTQGAPVDTEQQQQQQQQQ